MADDLIRRNGWRPTAPARMGKAIIGDYDPVAEAEAILADASHDLIPA